MITPKQIHPELYRLREVLPAGTFELHGTRGAFVAYPPSGKIGVEMWEQIRPHVAAILGATGVCYYLKPS